MSWPLELGTITVEARASNKGATLQPLDTKDFFYHDKLAQIEAQLSNALGVLAVS